MSSYYAPRCLSVKLLMNIDAVETLNDICMLSHTSIFLLMSNTPLRHLKSDTQIVIHKQFIIRNGKQGLPRKRVSWTHTRHSTAARVRQKLLKYRRVFWLIHAHRGLQWTTPGVRRYWYREEELFRHRLTIECSSSKWLLRCNMKEFTFRENW